MIGILIAILLAALVYWVCLVIGLPAIVAIIAAVLVLLSDIGPGQVGMLLATSGRSGQVPSGTKPNCRISRAG